MELSGDVIIKIIVAVIIGGAIGLERELKNKPAGFTTHMLLCVGACLIAVIQVKMQEDTIIRLVENPSLTPILKADSPRLIAQVISGIGFLGAGSIFRSEKGSVNGLTTAATLWVTACIGITLGSGYLLIGSFAGIVVLFIMQIIKKLEGVYIVREKEVKLRIEYYGSLNFIGEIKDICKDEGVKLCGITSIEGLKIKDGDEYESATIRFYSKENYDIRLIIEELKKLTQINDVYLLESTYEHK